MSSSRSPESIYRRILLNIWLLSLFSTAVHAATPNAISVPVSGQYFGDDGLWSTVSIRVGHPQQWFELIPSINTQETWVIGLRGCSNSSGCITKRGGVFDSTKSTTFNPLGFYYLDAAQTEYGYYGTDNVAILDQYILQDQIVSIINSTDEFVGSLGLGINPSNFTTDTRPTFLSTLAADNTTRIPGRSFGYTAGANYRSKGAPASLTFGGYDQLRFYTHPVHFTLDAQNVPRAAVQNIAVFSNPSGYSSAPSNWKSNPVVLMAQSQADFFKIDSLTPYLWLPGAVCDNFAAAMGLIYNDTLDLYLYNNASQRTNLINANLTFSFLLADQLTSGDFVNITLPFQAFDKNLSYPYGNDPNNNITIFPDSTSPGIPYFPLRRAANDSEYILGRTFLQEAYIFLDYDRHNFSIYQASFEKLGTGLTQIIDVFTPGSQSNTTPKKALSVGAIAGIVVGAAVAILLLVIGIMWLRRRKQPKPVASFSTVDEKDPETPESGTKSYPPGRFGWFKNRLSGTPTPAPVELEEISPQPPTELDSDLQQIVEAYSEPPVPPVELPAEDVSPSAYQASRQAINGGIPVEKDSQIVTRGSVRENHGVVEVEPGVWRPAAPPAYNTPSPTVVHNAMRFSNVSAGTAAAIAAAAAEEDKHSEQASEHSPVSPPISGRHIGGDVINRSETVSPRAGTVSPLSINSAMPSPRSLDAVSRSDSRVSRFTEEEDLTPPPQGTSLGRRPPPRRLDSEISSISETPEDAEPRRERFSWELDR